MYKKLLFLCVFALAGCVNGVPKGAAAWCGSFEYTGTWLKTETEGRAIGVSDNVIVERMTVADVIELATAVGCATD